MKIKKSFYNKANLGYEPYNNVKKFDKIFKDHKTPKCKTLKCNYGNINGYIAPFRFIKKSHESKVGHFPSYFYRKHYECKMKNMSTAYFYKNDPRENPIGIFVKLTLKDPK